MTLETSPWDSAELLESREDIAAYIEAAFEDGDPSSRMRWASSPAPKACRRSRERPVCRAKPSIRLLCPTATRSFRPY